METHSPLVVVIKAGTLRTFLNLSYDIGKNEGFVNVGISSDTAEFAVNSILRWWKEFGCKNYSDANKILIFRMSLSFRVLTLI